MKIWLALLCSVVSLWAKAYALIVVVSNYRHIDTLEGVKADRINYTEVAKRWEADEIVTLFDENATRRKILGKLKAIEAKLTPKDRFFMFFSGHGSNLYDPFYTVCFQKAHLTNWLRDSGAIFPYDFDPRKVSGTIIIGKRDLRPILLKIDRKVDSGVIVFDACFAETSCRSNGDTCDVSPTILSVSKGYPYKRLRYIASSVTEAQEGYFSRILKECVLMRAENAVLKECIARRMENGFQIPIWIEPTDISVN